MVIFVAVTGEFVEGYSKEFQEGYILFENPSEDFLNKPFQYKYINGELVIDEAKQRIIEATEKNQEYIKFLIDTDWKVLRHRDQLEIGIETSLTNEQYLEILRERQEARDSIVNK